MTHRLPARALSAALALTLALISCGDSSSDGDDSIFLNKGFGGALDVSIVFPDGGLQEVDLPVDDFSSTRVATSLVVGDVYQFSAQSPLPNIAPSDPISCTVSELAVCEGVVAVRVEVDPISNRVEISCRLGNWAVDALPLSECSQL